MKKIYLLAALLAVSTTTAMAQVSWGVKGGLNLANLTNNEGNADMKPSFYIGGFMEYRVSEFFGISPELLYSRQGFQAKEGGTIVGLRLKDGTTARLRLNYINLPILAKFYVAEGLSLDLGPQVGFDIGSDIWAKNGGEKETVDLPSTTYEIPAPNTLDVSFAMGLTYNFNDFFVQGRYNLGLTDAFEDDEANSKNSVIQLGVGYRF